MAALNFIDRYSSTVASAYSSGGTTLSVSSSTGLPADGTVNFYLIIRAVLSNGSPDGTNTEEVVHVTSKSGTTLTIAGAQANTSASHHSAGAQVIGSIMTSAAFTQLKTDIAPNPPGLVQLGQVITAASATSATFSSISGAYTNLVLVYACRSQAAVSTDGLSMELNSDGTSTDYIATQYVLANSTTASAGTVNPSSTYGAWINNVPGTSAPSNVPATGVIRIPVYSGTTFYKKWVHNGDYAQTSVSNITIQSSGTFKSTAAISAIVMSLGGDDFVNGSTFTLYGEL
jgi:hypothetical protein